MRAIIYARYSSDNQREASIEDQLEICRRYTDRQGWTLVQTYEDRALSGASDQRPAYQQMLADAEAGRFDVVLDGKEAAIAFLRMGESPIDPQKSRLFDSHSPNRAGTHIALSVDHKIGVT